MYFLAIILLLLVLIGIVVTLVLTRNNSTLESQSNPTNTISDVPVKTVAGIDCLIVNTCPVSAAPGGDPTFMYPVGTILMNETPPEVQKELMASTSQYTTRRVELPQTFDAREKWPGLISEPYQQGKCGSCWAFAAALAVSDKFRIKYPENKELRLRFNYKPFGDFGCYEVINNLSPYELVYCDICVKTRSYLPESSQFITQTQEACDMGCSGGILPVTYNYMLNTGLSTIISEDSTPGPRPVTPPQPVAPEPGIPPQPVAPEPGIPPQPVAPEPGIPSLSNCCSCTTGLPIITNDPSQCCQCSPTFVRASSAVVNHTCCDPYLQDCPCEKTGGTVYKPTRVYSLVGTFPEQTVYNIMSEVYENGPVTIGFTIYSSFYKFYSDRANATKVYGTHVQPPSEDSMGGHAVDIVGWGTDRETGIFYWLIRNSWGISWADGGYYRMQYDFGGLLSNVYSAAV
jgi:hypothetical protein